MVALDWAGTLVAGVVGCVGIAATYWSGTKARIAQTKNLQFQLEVQGDRARLADKRQIYASFMCAISGYVAAERRLTAGREKDLSEERLSVLRSELNVALDSMLNALCEIRLIAPEDLTILSVNVVHQLTRSEDLSGDFPEIRDRLYAKMRADLGEPRHEKIDAPEIVSNALDR